MPCILESAKFKVIKGHEVLTFAPSGRGLYFILMTGIAEPQDTIKSVPRLLRIPVYDPSKHSKQQNAYGAGAYFIIKIIKTLL